MIDVAIRLRRAIHRNDLLLVRRIVRNNPQALQNPDFANKSNTSLHLAAKHGFLDIAAFLIDIGHENDGISRNTDHDTPLMLAAAHEQVEVGKLLIARFPQCVPYTNKNGMDTLMQASLNGASALLPTLLSAPYPCSPHAHDNDGNTALHHASAAGELKCLRLLLQAGASPHALNAYAWTPIAYSRTKDAKIYFEELVAELERRKDDSRREEVAAQQRVLRAKAGMAGGVRLVTQADSEGSPSGVAANGGGISPSSGGGGGAGISITGNPMPMRSSPREEHRRLMDALPPLRTSVDQAREINTMAASTSFSSSLATNSNAAAAASINKQMPPPPPPALDKPLPPPGGVSAEQRSAGSGWSPTTTVSSSGGGGFASGRPMTPKGGGGGGGGGGGTPTGRADWIGGGFGPVRSRE
ncbi:ankyrin repeat-containing domain protein [Phyllosticta citricarpa]|uniref:Ankyrin repeat-containing domain protein n=2 Tax=Phyllosticta TaxID=121621 RepID=A0ABR1MKW4_9PEZI